MSLNINILDILRGVINCDGLSSFVGIHLLRSRWGLLLTKLPIHGLSMKIYDSILFAEGSNSGNVPKINALSLRVNILNQVDLLVDSSELIQRKNNRKEGSEAVFAIMVKLNCVKMDRDNALKFLSSIEAKLCIDLIRWYHSLSLVNINENGLSLILSKTELNNIL